MLNDFFSKIRAPRDHEPTVISLGQVWVDVMMDVAQLPHPGEFIASKHVSHTVSGSFRVMQAAARMGARTEHAGLIGAGDWSNIILKSFANNHIDHIGEHSLTVDNGFRIVLNDGVNKTFIATYSIEAHGDAHTFDAIHAQAGDVVQISGNALFSETSLGIEAFLRRNECSPHTREFAIVVNPTNALGLVSDRMIEDLVLARPIWSCNRQEARTLANRLGIINLDEGLSLKVGGNFDESMVVLCEALGDALDAPLVLRAGSRGAWVRMPKKPVVHIEGYATKSTHTRSAGPCHTGVLCALLAKGYSLEEAVQFGNAASSIAIARNKHGMPMCPTFDDTKKFIESQQTEARS